MSLSSLIVVSKRFGNLNGEKKRPAGLWKYIFFLPHRIVLSVKRDSSGSSILAVPPPPFYCHSVELLQVTKTNLCPPRLLGCSLLRTHSFGRVSMHLALKFSSRNRSYIIINIDFSLISHSLLLSFSRFAPFARILARHSGRGFFYPSSISSSWELLEIPTSTRAKRGEGKGGYTAKRRPSSSQKPVNFLYGYYRWTRWRSGWNKLTFFRFVRRDNVAGGGRNADIYAHSRPG